MPVSAAEAILPTVSSADDLENGHPTFEDVLADIVLRFMRLPAEEISGAIEDALRDISQHLQFDRAVLWQVPEDDPNDQVLTHVWQMANQPEVARRPDPTQLRDSSWALGDRQDHAMPIGSRATSFVPQLLEMAKKGECIVIPDVEVLPEGMARERELLRNFRCKALVSIPIHVGKQLIGAVTFETLHGPRPWPDQVVRHLKLIGQMLGSAISRSRSDLALRRATERMTLAVDGAKVALWGLDPATGAWWVTDLARELHNIQPGVAVEWRHIEAATHPEDRANVRAVIAEAIASGTERSVEYRVCRPDGTIRWLLGRGRLHREPTTGTQELMGVTIDITPRILAKQQLETALAEVRTLRDALEQENTYLRDQVRRSVGHDKIVGESPVVLSMLAEAERVGPTDSVVLISGETGTGKELLAEAIHLLSKRSKRGMVKVNCAALPPSLIESELFGREKGAYTGAMTQLLGRFEAADGSTIFLDEITELPLELQPKLLRVLQEGQFERLGSNRTRTVNVRVIAATNRNIEEMVAQGQFRADLYYRLNVYPLMVPPLRERRGDLPLLIWTFVRHFATKMGKAFDSIPRQSMEVLTRYPWPGNIRELRNHIERAVIQSDSRVLKVQAPNGAHPATAVTLEQAERQHILAALLACNWRVSGPSGAAEILDVIPTTLYSKMKKLGIQRPTVAKKRVGVRA